MPRSLARLRHDQAEMQPQHAVIGPAMRRQMLARLQDREHHRDQAGDILAAAPGLRAQLDIVVGAEAVAAQEKGLPAAVLADDGDVGRQFVEAGQVVLAGEHAVELGADRAPIALDQLAPRKHRVVVDRRIADLAEFEIEPLDQGDHGHEGPRDQARPLQRLDAGGAEILGRGRGRFRPAALQLCSNRLLLPATKTPQTTSRQ